MPHYQTDSELAKIGAAVIKKYRPELKDLAIAYMFRDEAAVSSGKLIAGRCIRVDDRNRTLHEHDIIIEIAKDVWSQAEDRFKEALMDHELGHIGIRYDEDGTTPLEDDYGRIRTFLHHHDIEEFDDVLERHGAYHADLRKFLKKFEDHKAKAKEEGSE